MGKNSKKAMELPINVIIVAALALTVLVVVAVAFTGRFKIFSESLESCSTKQGKCKPSCDPNNDAVVRNAKCPEPGDDEKAKTCCIQALSE